MTFRFENSGAHTGAYNMERDSSLVEEARAQNECIVRVYAWQPYAVSQGYNQDEKSIDRDACACAGIDVVRRPTGGRAVLHAEEITYSVITPLGELTPHQWYEKIHRAIAQGFLRLGLNDADFVKSQPDFNTVYKQPSSALCFTSSARYELEWGGKKFVGSAQRVINGVLLQHGSILLGKFHERLPEFLYPGVTDAEEKEKSIARMKEILRARSISIGEILGREITYNECVEPLLAGFEEEFAAQVTTPYGPPY
jgi:lipoate-protein ligase A